MEATSIDCVEVALEVEEVPLDTLLVVMLASLGYATKLTKAINVPD